MSDDFEGLLEAYRDAILNIPPLAGDYLGVERTGREQQAYSNLLAEHQRVQDAYDALLAAYDVSLGEHKAAVDSKNKDILELTKEHQRVVEELRQMRAALHALREWHKGEYQSNPDINAQADAALKGGNL